MFSLVAAAMELPVPSVHRGTKLPVCMGAALVILAVALVPSFVGLSSVAGLAALSLTAAAVALLLTLKRVQASEGALRSAREAQRHVDEENAELRRFAMTVAHDLRAPLVSTTGFLNMAKESVEVGELDELLGLLDRAEAATERMDGLISGILDLATDAKEPTHEVIQLDEAVDNALENLHDAMAAEGIEVRRDAPLGQALADSLHVQQVFDNLLGNALKYGRPVEAKRQPVIEIRSEKRAGVLRISVGDNGPGIDHERMGEILAGTAPAPNPSSANTSSVRPSIGGNIGLGLRLVRQAMNASGGTLSLRTSSMGGAEFVLDFQTAPCPTTPTPPTQADAQSPPTTSKVAAEAIPNTLPEHLQTELISAHSCSSSRMMLTTG